VRKDAEPFGVAGGGLLSFARSVVVSKGMTSAGQAGQPFSRAHTTSPSPNSAAAFDSRAAPASAPLLSAAAIWTSSARACNSAALSWSLCANPLASARHKTHVNHARVDSMAEARVLHFPLNLLKEPNSLSGTGVINNHSLSV
jgi:hypothetical protein